MVAGKEQRFYCPVREAHNVGALHVKRVEHVKRVCSHEFVGERGAPTRGSALGSGVNAYRATAIAHKAVDLHPKDPVLLAVAVQEQHGIRALLPSPICSVHKRRNPCAIGSPHPARNARRDGGAQVVAGKMRLRRYGGSDARHGVPLDGWAGNSSGYTYQRVGLVS